MRAFDERGLRKARRGTAWMAVAFLAAALPACEAPLAPDSLQWTISPAQTAVRPGEGAVFTITIHTKANINAAVDLRVANVPAGLVPSFTSMRLADTASTATLTVQASPGMEAGTYSFSVTAAEVGGSQSSEPVQLSVSTSEAPDMTLEVDPLEFYLAPNGPGKTFTYYVRPVNGFRGVVSASLSAVPSELILDQPLTPTSITLGGGGGGTFVLRRRGVADRPFADLTVTAVSGTLVKTRRVHILFQQTATPGT
jgi:uncharacterized protein